MPLRKRYRIMTDMKSMFGNWCITQSRLNNCFICRLLLSSSCLGLVCSRELGSRVMSSVTLSETYDCIILHLVMAEGSVEPLRTDGVGDKWTRWKLSLYKYHLTFTRLSSSWLVCDVCCAAVAFYGSCQRYEYDVCLIVLCRQCSALWEVRVGFSVRFKLDCTAFISES